MTNSARGAGWRMSRLHFVSTASVLALAVPLASSAMADTLVPLGGNVDGIVGGFSGGIEGALEVGHADAPVFACVFRVGSQ